MKNNIILGITCFIIGLVVSVYLDHFFRLRVIELYEWTSGGGIRFVGKPFYLSAVPFYYIMFGLSFLIFGLAHRSLSFKKIIVNGLIWVGLFSIALVSLCALDANLKVMTCTACEDGIFKIDYFNFKHELVLGFSALIASIPSYLDFIKQKNQLDGHHRRSFY